jgi:hypothetical protein
VLHKSRFECMEISCLLSLAKTAVGGNIVPRISAQKSE